MGAVASRELRNQTRAVLERVEAGEVITITVDGRPVALLQPLARRPRWLPRSEFVADLLAHQADPQLASDLELLAGESTADLPFR